MGANLEHGYGPVEVDPAPAQPGQLAKAQARAEQGDHMVPPEQREAGQQPPGLLRSEGAALDPAEDLLGIDPTRWEVVVRHEVPDALPVQPAPYSAERPVRVGDLVVCGDHRDTGSIQGALVSGQRAADAVLGSGQSR